MLPSSAGKRLENRRPPDIIEQPIPVDGVFQVVERLRSDVHVARIALLREQYRLGDGDSQLRRDRIVEILVVGRPPEGIVDDVGAFENGVLQKAAVILDFVRDAVDDHAVPRRLAHARAAQLHKFRGNAVFLAEFVHSHDKRRRKAVFPPAEKADLFHLRAPARKLWYYLARSR